tara:strand:- start:2223 stop:3077 length:855 start_codon:yes stop_codon:yes gene_type:complete
LSRNKERIGAASTDTNVPPQAVMQNNSEGFSFVVPTEFVELPSGGKFYPEGHPLHGEDSIEIKQMTAKEEDMLTSRTLLRKGIAIDRVLESLILDKRVNPNSLLVGDRNAIIVATRVSGYGSDYNTKVSCPACGTNQEYSFDLQEAVIYRGEDIDSINATGNGDGTYEVELPKSKLNVTFRLLTGNDEKRLLDGIEFDRKKKHHERGVTRQITNIAIAVNGDSSPAAINYLAANIPSMDSRHLRLAYRLATPNVDLTQEFECGECQHAQDMEVPLTADFFWPDR